MLTPADDVQAWYDANPGGTAQLEGTFVRFTLDVNSGAPRTLILPAGTILDGDGVERYAFNYRGGDGLFLQGSGAIIENYVPDQQRGAINAVGSTGWRVHGLEIRNNAWYGIRIGHAMEVIGNDVHHNGTLGIGGVGQGLVLVENNEIHHNNWKPGVTNAQVQQLYADDPGWSAWLALMTVDPAWEGGGTKFVKTDNLVLRGNHVHTNAGAGLWPDIDNINVLIENNLVEWNANDGIKHEISYASEIRNNTARYNGLAFDVWGWGAQIMVQNSTDSWVHDNVVTVSARGGNGIVSINQSRGSGAHGAWVSTNLRVEDNTVVYEASRGRSGVYDDTGSKPSIQPGAQAWDANDYSGPQLATRNAWERSGTRTWDQWRGLGYDPTGQAN